MASEISLICKATVSKTGTTITNATSTKTLDMTGTNMFHGVLNVTNTRVQIETSFTGVNVAANYWVLVRNQDTVTEMYLYLTDATTYPVTVVPIGSLALVQCVGGKSLWAVTGTGTGEMEVLAWEV